MATADVIFDMGETFVSLLRAGIPAGIVAPAQIAVANPENFAGLSPPAQPNVTVFLYQVSVNSEMRNTRSRATGGAGTSRPLLPLELHYLVTAWATDPRVENRIIGRVLQVLNDHAELGPADLQGASWSQEDTVQIVLQTLAIEELFRIWDTTDVPYRLSLSYMARVVGIESAIPEVAVPVLEAHFRRPPP